MLVTHPTRGRLRALACPAVRHVTRTPFRTLPASELAALEDDALLAHAVRARRAREADQERLVHWVLWDRHARAMRRRVQLRIPEHLQHHLDTVFEWVGVKVIQTALRLQFDGTSPGEWTRYWQQAVDRQVISFWRTAQGQALEAQTALPSEHTDDESPPDRLGVPLDVDRLVAAAAHHAIIEDVLAAMDNPKHVQVVRLAFFADLASADVAARTGESVANVDQIKSRFRQALRAALVARGITGS